MTEEEDRTHFSMWCLMQSPLLLGNDLTKMSQETYQIVSNREMIAINQSPFVYQARRIADGGDLEVWARPLVSTMSGEVVVGLLNRSEQPSDISFDLSGIGMDASAGYTTRDIWKQKDYGTSTAEIISREVPGHGIVVLRIKGTAKPFNVFQYKDQ